MQKIAVEVVLLGIAGSEIKKKVLSSHKSSLFEIREIGTRELYRNVDFEWGYSDAALSEILPEPGEGSKLVFGVVNTPLEGNYYLRRIGSHKCILSMYQTKAILEAAKIPFELFILRSIYAMLLVMLQSHMELPKSYEDFFHTPIHRCLFDMNGIKTDILHSAIQPEICKPCQVALSRNGVTVETLDCVMKELKKINISVLWRIKIFIDAHIALSIAVGVISAILLSLMATFIANIFMRG